MKFENCLQGDLRDALRVLTRREAVSYAREFVARHRRIHQHMENYARSLDALPETVPLAAIETVPPAARETAPVKSGKPAVRVQDAVAAVQFCRDAQHKRVSEVHDALRAEFPAAPAALVARAALDALGARDGSIRLEWAAVSADGATVENVVRAFSTRRRAAPDAARALLVERLAETPRTLSLDIEASVEANNTHPIVHAVAWCSDAGGAFSVLVAPTDGEVATLREAGMCGSRVGLYGKFVRTPDELPRLQREGAPLPEVADKFRRAANPETFVLGTVVGFNLAQDARRLLLGETCSTSASAVCDVMIDGPRKTPTGQWMRLNQMCAMFGVSNGTPHDAHSDAAAVLSLHAKLKASGNLNVACECLSRHGDQCPRSVFVLR